MKHTIKKGFTLIELLVVIAIIGILASIITSQLADVQDRSRNAKSLQEMKHFFNALQASINDNAEYISSATLPASINGEPIPQISPSGDPYNWVDNTSNAQKFCVWDELQNNPEFGFYIINETGYNYSVSAPTSIDDCEFSTVAEATTEMCHFPVGNVVAFRTVSVPESEVADHISHGDSIGACDPRGEPWVAMTVCWNGFGIDGPRSVQPSWWQAAYGGVDPPGPWPYYAGPCTHL